MNKRNTYLEQIQAGVDFIEQHLDQEIEVSCIAKIACMSQWHFQRIFKALTNETLKTYIRSRRMTNAQQKLAVTDQKILEIALLAGYETAESFSRAFNLAFGMTPSAYRKIGDAFLFHRKIQLSTQYMEQIKMNEQSKPVIYKQKPLKLIGLHTQFYGIDSEKNNADEKLTPLWNTFESRFEEIGLSEDAVCYGVIGCEEGQEELLDYYAAVEVKDCSKVPADMLAIDIPEATRAKFIHRGEDRKLEHTVSYIYGNWLLQSGKEHTYGYDLEIFHPEHDPDSAESFMHYAIPIVSD